MPRKRLKPQTENDIRVASVSPTSIHETRSPYFSAARDEVTEATQGEPRARTCKRKGVTEEESDTLPATLPDPALPPQPLSLPVQSCGSGRRLMEDFFDQECVALAKALLGKVLVRIVGGRRVSARVVETEGYLGGPDLASHSSGGKRTPRNEPMYMKPGTAYVYSIYGMYYCFNVSSKGDGACVLVRAAEPLEGMEVMVEGRGKRRGINAPPLKPHQLCNGPSKLCQALALTKESANKLDLSVAEEFWVEEEEEEIEEEGAEEGGGRGEEERKVEGEERKEIGKGGEGGTERKEVKGEGRRGIGVPEDRIVVSTRIGIDSYGAEWAKKPLRFYILGNKCVSVKDKDVERAMLE